jgi:hypothetical protein
VKLNVGIGDLTRAPLDEFVFMYLIHWPGEEVRLHSTKEIREVNRISSRALLHPEYGGRKALRNVRILPHLTRRQMNTHRHETINLAKIGFVWGPSLKFPAPSHHEEDIFFRIFTSLSSYFFSSTSFPLSSYSPFLLPL